MAIRHLLPLALAAAAAAGCALPASAFTRRMVLEEYTGVSCGYCPLGIVCLEKMNQEFPDAFIGIAVHNYGYDPMKCADYSKWAGSFASGAPSCSVNRNKQQTNRPEFYAIRSLYNRHYKGDYPLGVEVSCSYDSSVPGKADITATVSSTANYSDVDFAVTFVVTEDFVGPYTQANYYSGGGMGELEGFSDKGGNVEMKYNDVARAIARWDGIRGSMPDNIEAGGTYTYTIEDFGISAVTKVYNAHAIALLLDMSTGEILSGAKVKIDPDNYGKDDGWQSLDSTLADNGRIVTDGRTVRFEAQTGVAEVYTPGGARAVLLEPGESVTLAPGIYLVRTAAGTRKVVLS